MRPGLVLAALGSAIKAARAAAVVKDGEPIPASWCITYLSTYLAPVSTKLAGPASSDTVTDRVEPSFLPPISRNPPSVILPGASSTEEQQSPDSFITSVSLSSVTFVPLSSISSSTLLLTDIISSDPISTATAGLNPGGRNIIFQVVPSTDPEKRDLSKRALGGFVGGGSAVNPDACTDAVPFSLTSGQLLDNDIPIYYDGEDYKMFSGQGPPPDNAITTTFQNVGGSLRFVNPSLPDGQASFCQDPITGQVYITFFDQPGGCRPVSLAIFTVEQCLNGELDARASSDSASAPTAIPTVISSSETETSHVAVSTDTMESGSSELPETLPRGSASSEASPKSTGSLTATTIPEDTSSSIVRTQPTDASSPSVETSTDGNPPASSEDDVSLTNAPTTTSPLSEPPSSVTDPSDTDPSTSDLPATDSSSTFLESSSSTEPSSSLASADFSLDSTTDLPFSATSSEASSTDSLPITDDTTSLPPMTTEPSTTESLESSSSETIVSTEPTSSFSDSDTTTSADTTTSEPTTTTSAEVEPTVLFAADDFDGHQGASRVITSDFLIYMYDTSAQYLTISVNGAIQLGVTEIDDSPHRNLPADTFYGKSVFPYWTENSIRPFSEQGITYRTLGTEPGRALTIEFKVKPDANQLNDVPDHYTVTFFENRERNCLVRYFSTYGKGADATIGNQQTNTGPVNGYSYNVGGAISDRSELYMLVETDGEFSYNGF